MTLAKNSVQLLSASALGCAFLLAGAQMGCEPADDGVSPRDTTTPRDTTPATPPVDPYEDPADPMDDPYEPGTQPGGTQPGSP